jgi:exodeoxyribonuclease VII small subunit
VAPIPFEEALKRLGSVVEAMERDDLPLDDLLTRFEEGTRLARQCQEQLNAAELKITRLEQSAGGELVTQPFAPLDEGGA